MTRCDSDIWWAVSLSPAAVTPLQGLVLSQRWPLIQVDIHLPAPGYIQRPSSGVKGLVLSLIL